MKEFRLFLITVLSVFMVTGNVMASMVDIGDPASGERWADVVIEDAFGPGFVQVDNPGTFGDLSGVTLTVVEGDAAWNHTFGTYMADSGEYGVYMNSRDGTFYTEASENADGYDHFAVFYNEDSGAYAWAVEDQNQTKTWRAWLDHDHNDVVASTVPIPGAVWLFASGLVGLVGLRRRFKS